MQYFTRKCTRSVIFVIKDKIQKEVYGLGYPSIPVLSVDEFYEQRVKEGWWKPPSSNQTALQVSRTRRIKNS